MKGSVSLTEQCRGLTVFLWMLNGELRAVVLAEVNLFGLGPSRQIE